MSSQPPSDATLGNVLNYISNEFGRLYSQIIDLANRQDKHRDNLGAYNQQNIERFGSQDDRIERLEEALEKQGPLVETIGKSLGELRPVIEAQLTHAARVAESVQRNFSDVSARYQQSIIEMQVDFDERREADRRGFDARLATLEAAQDKRQAETAEVTKTRILSRANILIALITFVGAGLIGGLVSIVVAIVSRGSP